jgi:hypothetical protein
MTSKTISVDKVHEALCASVLGVMVDDYDEVTEKALVEMQRYVINYLNI